MLYTATGMFSVWVLVVSLGISVLIVVPLAGAIVRLRANYNPKGLQLDTEGGVQPHAGPVVTSMFGMIRRVYRIEGWAGLYKGLMPALLCTAVITWMYPFFGSALTPSLSAYYSPVTEVLWRLLNNVCFMLISLPIIIIEYRAITTPYRLPYFKPMYSLRKLLTAIEFRKPWVLYFTPGLLPAQIVHIVYVNLGVRTIRRFLLPELYTPRVPNVRYMHRGRLAAFLALLICSTAILTPLEIITTRLVIQRNRDSSELNPVVQEEEGDANEANKYTGEEDVIGFRSESDPYLGLADCAKRIVDEEGYGALYRTWWLTMLSSLGGALS